MKSNKLARFAGSQVARQAIQKHTTTGGALDLRFGLHLLARDRNVPVSYKMLGLALGGALTWLLIALEIPLESLLAVFLPVLGLGADLVINGMELIVCPVLFGALLLPHLAPKAAVQSARALQAVPVRA